MILTPKNWKSFQHYKERTPSWIKLHKGLLTDFEFVRLPVASKALAPMLWLLASEYEEGAIDASLEKIAFRVHMTVAELQEALSPLIDSGFFDASEALAKPGQVACLEKRREENIDKRRLSSASRTSGNEDFENLKKEYPKRSGNYGWKAAERKFLSLVKTGVDPKIIIAAARRFAAGAGSKAGTEFIPMPATWLNSEDFAECAVVAFEPNKTDWDTILSVYKKNGVWSKWAGSPEPGMPGCRCPIEKLVEYGLAPDQSERSIIVPRLQSI